MKGMKEKEQCRWKLTEESRGFVNLWRLVWRAADGTEEALGLDC
jgi:hypothetical protein